MQTTGYTQQKQGQIRLYQRISERDSTDLETNVLERWNQNELSNMVEVVLWLWACMAPSRTRPLVFIDDVPAARSSRMNCDAYTAILSTQTPQV